MKNHYFSSLFILTAVIAILLATTGSMNAQKRVDSAGYYYRVIVRGENISKVDRAFNFYESRLDEHLRIGDSINAAYYLEVIAIGKYNFGDFNESEQRAVNALALIDLKQDSVSKGVKKGSLNLLGVLYRKRKAFKEAHELYEKSFELATTASDSISIINNIANLLRDQEESRLAIDTLDFAYKMALDFGDELLIASAVDNLGHVQSLVHHQDALSNLQKGLSLRLKNDNSRGLFASYLHLTGYYKDRGSKQEALLYAEKALSAADLCNDTTFELEALGLMLELDSNPRNRRFKFLSDSLRLVAQERAYSYASMQFNVEKERQRTYASEIKREEERSRNIAIQAIAIVVLVIALFTILMIRMRHKKEKVREVFLTESRIAKKVHDEVANDVYQVMAKLQSHSNSKDELLDDLDQIYSKTRDISKEHSLIDVSSNFEEQLDDLFRSYETSEISVVTQNNASIDWDEISELKKKTIYKVLQELLTNMRKHSKASHALIKFEKSKRKMTIHYKDNGLGCTLEKSDGLQNVENRMAALNGRITFESEPNKGFEAKMVI